MKRYILPILILIVLVAGLVVTNHGMNNNATPDIDDDDAPKTDTSTKAAKTIPDGHSTTNIQPAQSGEVLAGDPKAKYKVALGWVYDDATVKDDSQVNKLISDLVAMANKSGGQMCLTAVDIDIPDSERSAAARGIENTGVTVNGQPTINVDGKPVSFVDNIGEGASTPDAIERALATLK